VAGTALDEWSKALDEAKGLCRYDAAASKDAAQLALDIQKCFEYLRSGLADAFNRDIPAYSPVKLPFSHVGGTETSWDNSHRGDVDSINCQLLPGQFLVGVDLAKPNKSVIPTAWLRYVTWDEYSGTLRPVQEKSRCGADTTRDATFSTPATISTYQANLILDVGASIGGSKVRDKGNGQVTRLCVRYRQFNFKTLQFEGGSKINCDGKESSESTEAHTGKLYVSNSAEPLFGLIIGGDNSTFKYMRGIHLRDLSRQYDYKPWRTLVSGGKYSIKNSAGKFLTVQGTATNSRGLTVAAGNGSDDQVWLVEAVNDREFRLVPVSYEGFVTRSSQTGTTTSVNRPASDDATTVNFLQHWRLEQLVNGDYLIQSVLDDKKVLAADLKLEAFSAGDTEQEWQFVRLDDPRDVVTSTQSLALTLPSISFDQNYDCAGIVDSRDKTGNPRYFNRIILGAALKRPPVRGEIRDDARQLLATWSIGGPVEKPFEIVLPRYASTKKLRFCGIGYDAILNFHATLNEVKIEALCKFEPGDPGPLEESCQRQNEE
jgi:hypothetical protein